MKNLQEIRDELKMIRECHFVLSSVENDVKILVPSVFMRLTDRYFHTVIGVSKPVQRLYRGCYFICKSKECRRHEKKGKAVIIQ